MFVRLSNSWRLFKSSWWVLAQDTELILFPILSGLANLLVLASFAAGAWGLGLFETGAAAGGESHGWEESVPAILLGLGLYLSSYFVVIYFNAALVGAAFQRLQGGDPTVASGLAAANRCLGSIFLYAVIAATVGLILRTIQERSGWLGRMIGGLLGMAWSLLTYLVLPVLVVERLSAMDGIRRSASLIRKTWGEQIVGNVSFGLVGVLLVLPVLLLGVPLMMWLFVAGTASQSVVPLVVVGLGTLLYVLLVAAMVSAAQGVYHAALYAYAANHQARGFPVRLIESAFSPRS